MSTIDTAVASALASRVDSLMPAGTAGSAIQTGASALSTELPVAPGSATLPASIPQASAQTVLSAVALTLDAIMRTGGEATPASIGLVPVWPVAPALDVMPAGLPLFDIDAAEAEAGAASGTAAGADAAASASSSADGAASASATASASGATMVIASQMPVDALAAALEQTVADTGLFYESHLSQWLSGERTPDSLTSELQNRLATASMQLPLDWSDTTSADPAASGAGNAWARQNGNPSMQPCGNAPARGGMQNGQTGASNAQASAQPNAGGYSFGAPGAPTAQSLRAALSTGLGQDASSADAAQSIAASIHPATVPIVRQQLDLLATGQFRWTGEAWPGAKFDWVIEEDDSAWQRGASREDDADRPWRTRITLSLPSLGTVDAELTLSGTRLIARVQANAASASRLAAQGEAFRQRLADAGIALHGLAIREIDGGGASPAAAAQAASAYARASAHAAAAAASAARAGAFPVRQPAAPVDDTFDWDMT